MTHSRTIVATAISLALVVCGCKTSSPKPDTAVEGASKEETASGEETASKNNQHVTSSSSQEVEELVTSEAATVVIEVTPELLTIDGDEILSLSDGYVRSSGFESQRYFSIRGVVEPVEEALVVERRRRVVYGEEPAVERVLVRVDPKVPVDTILGLHYTLAATSAQRLTIEIGEQTPLEMALSADFIGARRVAWSSRKPTQTHEDKAPEPEKLADARKAPKSSKLRSDSLSQAFESTASVGIGTVGKKKTILGSLSGVGSVSGSSGSASSGSAKGFGGLGLRGAGRGTGGLKNSNLGVFSSARYCDASAGAATKPLALTHATLKIFPTRLSTWLSEHHRGYRKYMYRRVEVDAQYPWWKVYNALSKMRSHVGEAETLLIWAHPSLGSEVLSAVTTVNCELPELSYSSGEAWQKARAEVSECKPLFDTQLLGNGKHPTEDR
jgi:hypothetical protein